jgi:hypothetical protein
MPWPSCKFSLNFFKVKQIHSCNGVPGGGGMLQFRPHKNFSQNSKNVKGRGRVDNIKKSVPTFVSAGWKKYDLRGCEDKSKSTST